MGTLEIDGNSVHFVDRGAGPAVLLVHGSPVSSFSFRHQIDALSDHFRVVAPDLLGFGDSEAPEEGAGFLEQARMLRQLIDVLELDRLSLVVHDWGGPIGMGALADCPERLTRLVLMNTTFLSDFRPPRYWRPFIAPGIGDLLVVRLNLVKLALRTLMKRARSREVRQVYGRSLQRKRCRKTVLQLERLRGYRPLMAEVESALEDLQVPTLILWGHPDPYFRPTELDRLQEMFDDVEVEEIPGGGHFPQEDAPEAVSEALLGFLLC